MIFIFKARIDKIENVFNLLERSSGKDSYDWRFKNLSGSQRQSHELNLTLNLTSGQAVETYQWKLETNDEFCLLKSK